MDVSRSIEPRSDQLNFDDLIAGPVVVSIVGVKAGSAERPVEIHTNEYQGRPYKPSKSMRRVLVYAWGAEADAWVGRSLGLYGDASVRFGGEEGGGIKIGHVSHMDKRLGIPPTASRGKRANPHVDPLQVSKPIDRVSAAISAFEAIGKTADDMAQIVGKPVSDWTPADLDGLVEAFKALQAGTLTATELIGGEEA